MFMGGFTVTVEGGEHLRVRAKMNMGSFIMFGLGTFAAEVKPVAAPPVAAPVAVPAKAKEEK
jgi:hypothetical protein